MIFSISSLHIRNLLQKTQKKRFEWVLSLGAPYPEIKDRDILEI